MEYLNKNQKIVLIIIATFMLLVIGYYFMQKTGQYDNFEIDEVVQNSNNSDDKENITSQDGKDLIIIHVTGAVIEEGVVIIEENSRIIDVIEKAGGTKLDADLSRVNLAYKVSDGQKIYIPSIYDEEIEKEVVGNSSGENIIIDGNIFESSGVVNINSATQTELETLTGIRTIHSIKNN